MLHIFVSNRPGDIRCGTAGRPVPGSDRKVPGEGGKEVGRAWVKARGKTAGGGTASSAMTGVNSADAITGPTDVIVRVETSTIDALSQMVVTDIHSIDGITRTQTCPVVNL